MSMEQFQVNWTWPVRGVYNNMIKCCALGRFTRRPFLSINKFFKPVSGLNWSEGNTLKKT